MGTGGGRAGLAAPGLRIIGRRVRRCWAACLLGPCAWPRAWEGLSCPRWGAEPASASLRHFNDEPSLGLRRILSQSTDSLNMRNRTLSVESLIDEGDRAGPGGLGGGDAGLAVVGQEGVWQRARTQGRGLALSCPY